jgi:hypothetical protein
MGWVMVSTMSLSVLFTQTTVLDPSLQAEARAREVQKPVDQNAASTRKAVDAQERGDTAP